MNLKSLISRWFGYSRRERVGSLILVIIVAAIIGLRLGKYSQSSGNENEEPVRLSSVSEELSPGSSIPEYTEIRERELFMFDPNVATKTELIELGLSEKQARTLINYRESGARFRRPEDFRKVYGISKEKQDELIAYIEIRYSEPVDEMADQGSADVTKSRGFEDVNNELFTPIGINSSDSIELMTIPGIGKVLGPRIVKYRNLLGGFYSSDQLSEVYGIDSMMVESIKDFIFLDTSKIRYLYINTAAYGDLIRHPYITKENTEDILRYRRLAGQIESKSELLRNGIFKEQDLSKIEQYISFSDSSIIRQ